jgi:hypothetical protein
MDVLYKGGSLLYTQLSTAARMALLLPQYVVANLHPQSAAAAAAGTHPGEAKRRLISLSMKGWQPAIVTVPRSVHLSA